jgi:hypothetical protein
MTLTADVLGYIKTNWPDGGFPSDLTRVNRNDSKQLERDVTSLTDALKTTNYVGARAATREPTPAGFAYDEQTFDAVVGVRVVGMDSEDKFGHIADHDAFRALVENIRAAVLTEREYPPTSTPETYCTLGTTNETDLSSNYRDYYRYDFDVVFSDGYQTLP